MRRTATVALVLVLGAGCGGPTEEAVPLDVSGFEEEPTAPVEAVARVDRAVATTGDLVTFTITVRREPDWTVEVDEPGDEIAGFRVVDLGHRLPEAAPGGRVTEAWWYELRADLVGSYVLPPVEVRAEGPGAEPSTLETSELFVEVESVLPGEGEATDIRDLKPLRRFERPVPWASIGLAVALVALGSALVAWWRRRARRPLPPAPPHEVAFAALEALRGTDFADEVALRQFYFAISEVVRRYVEDRFGLNATDLTTEEIVARLDLVPTLAARPAEGLVSFLGTTDAVKFAAHHPTEDEIEATYELALGFVEGTRPDEAEAAAA